MHFARRRNYPPTCCKVPYYNGCKFGLLQLIILYYYYYYYLLLFFTILIIVTHKKSYLISCKIADISRRCMLHTSSHRLKNRGWLINVLNVWINIHESRCWQHEQRLFKYCPILVYRVRKVDMRIAGRHSSNRRWFMTARCLFVADCPYYFVF